MVHYPNMSNYKDYENSINDIFENPDKIILDNLNNEYYYVRGDDLLRIKTNGEFVSLYPGVNSDLVKKAIIDGGIVWEK